MASVGKSAPASNKFSKNTGFKRQKNKKSFHRQKFKPKTQKWKVELEEIEELKQQYGQIDTSSVKKFTDIPLCKRTLEGLKTAGFTSPTEIQQESIGLALQGHDILGAAKTGSGKTIAFLIPILECLFRQRWSKLDGLGALIISPTRELAYQTFEVLRKIGVKHDFSAGLVIGGKHVKEESERINSTNIVICTPGRLLQHMDETVNFSANSLQVLVLDEADRILDLGFAQTMNAIIENLPVERQTLLFSATQTKSVKDLARLSLKNPMYVSVHEHSQYSTPTQLEQSYLVKFIYECFRRLRPGNSIIALHGGMHQLKRVDAYNMFCRKQHAVLFATDIAARGLDFPAVHWVIQLDCPEDANTYIHRVGRTARYEKNGESLLVLLPSEEDAMVKQLEDKKIPVHKIKINPRRQQQIQGKLDSLCASDVTLKEMAQRAFVAYFKAVFLMSNKKIFDVHKLDTAQYARSLGLAIPPRLRFIQKDQKRLEAKKNKQNLNKDNAKKEDVTRTKKEKEYRKLIGLDSGSDEEADKNDENIDEGDETSSDSESDFKNLMKSKDRTESGFDFGLSAENENEDGFLKVKSRQTFEDNESSESDKEDLSLDFQRKKKTLTKFAAAKKLKKKNLKVNTKVMFDEEGEVVEDVMKKSQVSLPDEEDEGGINIEVAKQRMREEDKLDKQIHRERIKKKHREERIKKKEKKRGKKQKEEEEEEGPTAFIGGEADDTEKADGNDWLDNLDPDKLWGPNNEKDSGDSSDDEGPLRKKKKVGNTESDDDDEDNYDIVIEEEHEESSDDDDDDDVDNDDSDENGDDNEDALMTLEDNEELALRLLQS